MVKAAYCLAARTAIAAGLGAVATSAVAQETSNAPAPADIVVTAQRREQRLADVPITISVASGQDLARANISGTKDLVLLAPGLRMEQNGPFVQPSIRGVTAQPTAPGAEQNVAVYLDGVYQPSPAGNIIDLPDVSRVEVLKGPQGTLFGRNATGGAIQIITLNPSFDTSGRFSASYGRFQETELKGYLTGGLVDDVVAVSITASHSSTNGWNRNLLDGGRHVGEINSNLVRAKLLVNVAEGAQFVLSGIYSRRTDEAISAYSLLDGNGAARRLGVAPLATRPYDVASDFYPSGLNQSIYAVSLRGTIETGIGTITTTSAFIDAGLNLTSEGDASPRDIQHFEIGYIDKSYSQEVLFASRKFGSLSFVAGAFAYYRLNGYGDPVLTVFANGAPISRQAFKTGATSYAAFTEGTLELTDQLSVIGGLRYTYEKRSLNNNYTTNPFKTDASFSNVSPRASIIYKLSGVGNVYATYSQGFKSGLYDTAGTPRLIRPEKLISYEVGFKSARSSVSFSASAFLYDYTNLQNSFLDPMFGTSRLENAGKAKIYGGEASLSALISPEFTLTLQGSYVHSRYKDYQNASVSVPLVNANGVPIGGNQTVSRDLSGFQLPRSPELTGNLSANYRKQMTAGTLDLSTTVYYSSSLGLETLGRVRQPKYAQVNALASWTFGQSGVTFGLYGKNLTNQAVILASSISAVADRVSYQAPRTYGVRLSYRF